MEDGYKAEGKFPIAGLVVRRYRSPKDEVFVITDTFFNYKYTKKDHSKFEFQNQEYKKGKLVHAVVKQYVENNPTKKFDELKEIFPDKLEGGSYGVFDTLENVNERRKKSKSDKARFHTKEDELISIPNVIIATCSQWGIGNIQNFVKHVNDTLGKEYTIEQK